MEKDPYFSCNVTHTHIGQNINKTQRASMFEEVQCRTQWTQYTLWTKRPTVENENDDKIIKFMSHLWLTVHNGVDRIILGKPYKENKSNETYTHTFITFLCFRSFDCIQWDRIVVNFWRIIDHFTFINIVELIPKFWAMVDKCRSFKEVRICMKKL